jgi:hypothetical protein
MRSFLRTCKDYNDAFHSPGDKPTTAPTAEHATPTPGTEPCKGTAGWNYRIPEALKEELKHSTNHVLEDKIISHSTSL